MSKHRTPAYPLRIEPAIMDRLKDIASEEGRSVNKQIEFIIKKYLEEVEEKQSK